jgi:hypothetical protein
MSALAEHPIKHGINIDLSAGAFDDLRSLAGERTYAAVLREAMVLEKMARDQVAQGGRIVFVDRDGTQREIVLR